VHQFGPHYVGGTETYTRSLARAQAAAGDVVAVFTRVQSAGRRPLETSVEDGLTVYRLYEPEPRQAPWQFLDSYACRPALAAFRTVLAAHTPDLVHVQHLKGLHHAIPGVAGVPVVLTLHDYWHFCGNAQLLRPDDRVCGGPQLWLNCVDCAAHKARSRLWWGAAPAIAGLFAHRAACLAGALDAASRIIAPSQFVYDTYAPRIAHPERLTVIAHGIDPLPDAPAVPPPDSRLRILYAGGLTHQKGVHILPAALRRLPPGTATLDICGDEQADPAYSAHLRALADGQPVTFHGAQDRAGLSARMAACDVVAIPSLWPETASLIAMEARAAGRRIIASDIGALRERVRSSADGWLAPAGDVAAWAEALTHIGHDLALICSAQVSGQAYSITGFNAISSVYEEMVSRMR